ncbi:MAG: hypothetical protein R2711_05850 [Acidimicrobiales bacterium]
MVDQETGKVLLPRRIRRPADVVDYFGDESAPSATCASTSADAADVHGGLPGGGAGPIRETGGACDPRHPRRGPVAIFLRNHDEPTFEMVTDDERDYMYAEYAKDPRMKRNVGISRWLPPLLENDRRIAELFHARSSASRAARSCTTATRSAWATTSTSATAADGVRTPMQQ